MANPERFRFARGPQPTFHDEQAVDDLFHIVTALTQEIVVLRERLDTHERIAQSGGSATVDEVDQFVVDQEVFAQRALRRQAIIANVFRSLSRPPSADTRSTTPFLQTLKGPEDVFCASTRNDARTLQRRGVRAWFCYFVKIASCGPSRAESKPRLKHWRKRATIFAPLRKSWNRQTPGETGPS